MSDAAVYDFLGSLQQTPHSREGQPLTNRGYDAGQVNHLNYNWQPHNRSADAEIQMDGRLMQARARDLARNDSLGIAAVDAWVRMLVGSGIPVFSDVMDEDRLPFDELNDAIDGFFDTWAAEEADVDRKTHHFDQQRLGCGEVVESGNLILLQCEDSNPKRLSPICFQVLEVDYLDKTKDRTEGPDQREIRHGIEYAFGGAYPVGYHLHDDHPHDLNGASVPKSEFKSADRVIHEFWKARPTQRIGVTWFHPVVKHIANMGGYLGDELTSARFASKFAVGVYRKEGFGDGLGFTGDDDDSSPEDAFGNALADLGVPIIPDMAAEDTIKVIESSRPGNAHAATWLRFMLGLMANGMRLSQQALTREPTGSFSGNKATRLTDQESLDPVYYWFARRLAQNVRQRVIERAFLEGRFARWVQPFEFKRNPRRWLRAEIPEPKLRWLDPNKEVDAENASIEGRINDFSGAWGRKGKTWRKGFRALRQQERYAERIGLVLPVETGRFRERNRQRVDAMEAEQALLENQQSETTDSETELAEVES